MLTAETILATPLMPIREVTRRLRQELGHPVSRHGITAMIESHNIERAWDGHAIKVTPQGFFQLREIVAEVFRNRKDRGQRTGYARPSPN